MGNASDILEAVKQVQLAEDSVLCGQCSCGLIGNVLKDRYGVAAYCGWYAEILGNTVKHLQKGFVDSVIAELEREQAEQAVIDAAQKARDSEWFVDRLAIESAVHYSKPVPSLCLRLRKQWLKYLAEHLEKMANE